MDNFLTPISIRDYNHADWKYEKNRIVYTFEIPANMTATVRLEGCDPEILKAGSYERVVSLQF